MEMGYALNYDTPEAYVNAVYQDGKPGDKPISDKAKEIRRTLWKAAQEEAKAAGIGAGAEPPPAAGEVPPPASAAPTNLTAPAPAAAPAETAPNGQPIVSKQTIDGVEWAEAADGRVYKKKVDEAAPPLPRDTPTPGKPARLTPPTAPPKGSSARGAEPSATPPAPAVTKQAAQAAFSQAEDFAEGWDGTTPEAKKPVRLTLAPPRQAARGPREAEAPTEFGEKSVTPRAEVAAYSFGPDDSFAQGGVDMTPQPIKEIKRPEVRAYWKAVATKGDNQGKPFLVADKVGGDIHVFDADGSFLRRLPALFGRRSGDALPYGKDGPWWVTPAGRFEAEFYDSEDYGAKVRFHKEGGNNYLFHRVPGRSATASPAQRRAALASEDPSDNRQTSGCVNLSPEDAAWLSGVFKPGGVAYIMPEDEEARKAPPACSS